MEENIVRPETSSIEKTAYSVKEIAEKLGIKERTAYSFCNNTKEFKVKRVGRLLRINKQSFDEWWDRWAWGRQLKIGDSRMASIRKRKTAAGVKYTVLYDYEDASGARKQKAPVYMTTNATQKEQCWR